MHAGSSQDMTNQDTEGANVAHHEPAIGEIVRSNIQQIL